MLPIKFLFYFLFLHSIHSQVQLNLYLTDFKSNAKNKNDLQHDCLYVVAPIQIHLSPGQIISYCMGEWPSKWKIEENNFDQKFTFADLAIRKITSHQLYLWSAPMDVIENYQQYLNELPNSEKTSTATQQFYNCTLPNFGPKCQYVLYAYKPHYSSLNELVHDYYCSNRYEPTTLTCYTHLQCNRGLPPSCLDWSEICDGKVDCLDDGQDEEHCWQIEIYECNENEYRCSNGQCIPQEFFDEYEYVYDCLDGSDEPFWDTVRGNQNTICWMQDATFPYEDVSCIKRDKTQLMPFTSSCIPRRPDLLLRAAFSVKPQSVSNECWTAFKCIIFMPFSNDPLCYDLCYDSTCNKIVILRCPDIIYATAVPILFGRIYLVYEKTYLRYGLPRALEPKYFCYNGQLSFLPNDNETRSPFNNDTCRLYRNLVPPEKISISRSIGVYIDFLNQVLHMLTSGIYNDSIICNKSIMYQCNNSNKCISKYRLFDYFQDCYHNDDEDILGWDKNCSIKRFTKHFKCQTTNECIPTRFIDDTKCHCKTYDNGICDDEDRDYHLSKADTFFSLICNNITNLFPTTIDSQNHTDETECDQWPCNNIYTRCDDFWNCLDGADELDCDRTPSLDCPSNNHICVSFETRKLMCLPIERANDDNVDCIGALDEPKLCRADEYSNPFEIFYCKNNGSSSCLPINHLCDRKSQCTNDEDERSCRNNYIDDPLDDYGICRGNYHPDGFDIAEALCKVFSQEERTSKRQYFKLGEVQQIFNTDVTHVSSHIFPRQSTLQTIQFYQPRCHRGLDLQIWLNKKKNITTDVCLCPPSFYGDRCQFQNQRVSVSIRSRAKFDSIQIPFAIIVSLIDDSDERIIHSYEPFTYISQKHCYAKFHVYLVYSNQPKDQTKNYSVHIDIYEKKSLNYRGSVIKPLLFPFLPIHRLSFILNVPHINDNINGCSDRQCIHGRCRRYLNDPNNRTFCQCEHGWSGRYCTIQHTCICSSDSLCIGLLANNRSLCVCPLNKMGDRCLLNNTACPVNQQNQCLNGGQCMAINDYRTTDNQFICICPKNFTGDKCELPQTKLIISFGNDIDVPSSIHIHLITVPVIVPPERSTTFKMIPFGQYSTTIYWTYPFHIVFVEWAKNYYLTVLQNTYNESTAIEKTLHSSDRCFNISELFNETIVNYHHIRRMKYYQIPCRTNASSRLACFYDDMYFCVCQDHHGERVANCFRFDHNMKMNCFDYNRCENGGSCYEENSLCPKTTVCACPVCFYGTRCQLTTSGFSLSLDAILGYHIRSNVGIGRQPAAVLVSLVLSIMITFGGLVNGILSLITFKDRKSRDAGCGIYLFCSSINILLTMIIFALKFLILLLSQMGSINNRSFLHVQCISLDFLLRFCLIMDQWLTACVAMERAYTIMKGINFNKNKTRFIAKLIIFGLFLISVGTSIHDPIYRRLFDEDIDEEKRIWCIANYPSAFRIVNSIMTLLHIIVPFIINLISAIIIVIISTRQRAAIQKYQKYQEILTEQIQKHKNLLIGPIVLIILAIPRLIISFASGCMKSTRDSWLFLLGYYISLIPPLLTFILFVLPSSKYYEIFRKAVNQYRRVIRLRS